MILYIYIFLISFDYFILTIFFLHHIPINSSCIETIIHKCTKLSKKSSTFKTTTKLSIIHPPTTIQSSILHINLLPKRNHLRMRPGLQINPINCCQRRILLILRFYCNLTTKRECPPRLEHKWRWPHFYRLAVGLAHVDVEGHLLELKSGFLFGKKLPHELLFCLGEVGLLSLEFDRSIANLHHHYTVQHQLQL